MEEKSDTKLFNKSPSVKIKQVLGIKRDQVTFITDTNLKRAVTILLGDGKVGFISARIVRYDAEKGIVTIRSHYPKDTIKHKHIVEGGEYYYHKRTSFYFMRDVFAPPEEIICCERP